MPLLILCLVLGVVGLFLALPGGRNHFARIGLVVLAAAGGALIAIIVQQATPRTDIGMFVGCALVALFAALRVVTHKKPVYSALYFVLLIVAVTGVLVLMQAEFLAAALVIVYAGAILVTYVFVIMLAQQAQPAPYDVKSHEPFWGCLGGFALLGSLSLPFIGPAEARVALPDSAQTAGTIAAVGTRLFTEYALGIQLAGVLLLAAMVGAIAIARRRAVADAGLEGGD